MMRGKLIEVGIRYLMAFSIGSAALGAQAPVSGAGPAPAPAQVPAPAAKPTFQSGIDLVRVAAVVRDRKGRFVQDLVAKDFEVLDDGQPRKIEDFRSDLAGISVALLFDVSGSMENNLASAREAATHVLSWLDAGDEAAVFTFDTRVDEVLPFTVDLKVLPASMGLVTPFGATSLHDAIARMAEQVGKREGRRRAVIVFTDGSDNASHLHPS
jgi:Ca-activated chloride channel homolog